MNEYLGESFDHGVQLVSLADIKKASTLGPNTIENAAKHIASYTHRVIGVDWGGGGADGLSRTAVVAAGRRPDGGVDIFYIDIIPDTLSPQEQCSAILRLMTKLKCNKLAHDYGGAGGLRGAMLLQLGLHPKDMVPMVYTSAKGLIKYNPPTGQSTGFWSVDKTKALLFLISEIRAGNMKFVETPYTEEFMALTEDRRAYPSSSDVYYITTKPKRSDDVCHATCFAALTLWHMTKYPPLVKKQADTEK